MSENEVKPKIQFKQRALQFRFWIAILGALIISGGIGYAGYEIGNGFASRSTDTITVTGYASTSATADSGIWTLSSSESSPTSASAAVDKVNKDANALTKYLTSGGITQDQISYGAVSTNPNYKNENGNQTSIILSYQANQAITVQSKDVALLNKLSNGIGALLQTGVNINNSGPAYYVSNLPSLRPQLLAQAMKDAQLRANSIVSAVGGSVGFVVSVSSGPFQVTTPDSTDTSGGGYYDTSSIDKTVSTTVTVSFKVQ